MTYLTKDAKMFLALGLAATLINASIIGTSRYLTRTRDHAPAASAERKPSTVDKCSGMIYLIYRDKNNLIANKLVALGPPNRLLTNVSISALGTSKLGRPGEVNNGGLRSAKGSFIYEIPNEMIREMLFALWILDTTVVYSETYEKRWKNDQSVSALSITVSADDSLQGKREKQKKVPDKIRSLSMPISSAIKYAQLFYSKRDYERLTCM